MAKNYSSTMALEVARTAPRLGQVNNGWRAQRGQSMVELAFVLPLFLILVFATIEIGRIWAAKHALALAAREGARILSTAYGVGLPYSSESEAQTAATNAVADYLNSASVAVTAGTVITPLRMRPGNDYEYGTSDDEVELNYSNAQRGERVGVRIQHTFETPLPILLKLFNDRYASSGEPGSTLPLVAQCLMDHE